MNKALLNFTFLYLLLLFGSLVFGSPESPSSEEQSKSTEIIMKKIGIALQAFYVDYNGYPTDLKELVNYMPTEKIEFKDEWSRSLLYTYSPSEVISIEVGAVKEVVKSYELRSLGPNGIKSDKDDVVFANGDFVRNYPQKQIDK